MMVPNDSEHDDATMLGLQQEVASLRVRLDTMEKHRTEDGLNALALRVALLIEDEYAKSHRGGRTQRLAKSQVIAREAIREALIGERKWDAWWPKSNCNTPMVPE